MCRTSGTSLVQSLNRHFHFNTNVPAIVQLGRDSGMFLKVWIEATFPSWQRHVEIDVIRVPVDTKELEPVLNI
jgi:hypothetical protein